MSALFVLALCLIFIFARWYLHDSRANLLREMGQDMNSQAAGKVALLTVWSGTLAGQVNVFVSQDMLRLFAAEVASAGVPASSSPASSPYQSRWVLGTESPRMAELRRLSGALSKVCCSICE